ncbi:hypothetical protein CA54_18770 [Symmachiella macrocystis]|uniref:Uncharacterized protein n=1 Tax=Symmachiella macrocystis TaxID=2527985 RepID=A0A5C6BNN7_9PLAN|nr:hypothetical protein CA54_18770 [Symmachiella macrocystis]
MPVFRKYRTHGKSHWQSQWHPILVINRDEALNSLGAPCTTASRRFGGLGLTPVNLRFICVQSVAKNPHHHSLAFRSYALFAENSSAQCGEIADDFRGGAAF